MVMEIPYKDEIYRSSKEYMKKKYPEEALYFDIAWEIFEEFVEKTESPDLDLKGPIVRFGGKDSIMAPSVIHAFYIIFLEMGETIDSPDDDGSLGREMKRILASHKFAPQFATEIVDFFLGKQP
ncbi:MAG: hypothetical protein HXS41_12885 [Theionarchaea archaeon]|nr:hypothetical protein [Theionarchaea archaeon]MBU6999837.1 hypothetical protein [Theionarchaea archaeon]MBU7021948.1 hypothetical protein [Theionarchaea archaeon]MBU7035223.1 hypothetical protein [Theionarchaea archaeon]MBU7040703.1 hypothetical protein [Theionarchaea archaeon]